MKPLEAGVSLARLAAYGRDPSARACPAAPGSLVGLSSITGMSLCVAVRRR